jgi:hypothetical protein
MTMISSGEISASTLRRSPPSESAMTGCRSSGRLPDSYFQRLAATNKCLAQMNKSVDVD